MKTQTRHLILKIWLIAFPTLVLFLWLGSAWAGSHVEEQRRKRNKILEILAEATRRKETGKPYNLDEELRL